MGCHALLRGIFPAPGLDLMSLMSPTLAGGFFTASGRLGQEPHLACCVTESLGVAGAKASIPGPSEQGFPWILGLWFPGGHLGFLFSDPCSNPRESTVLHCLPPWAGLGWTPAPRLPGTTPCDRTVTMTAGQNDSEQPQGPGEPPSLQKGIGPGRGRERRCSEGPAYRGGVTRPAVGSTWGQVLQCWLLWDQVCKFLPPCSEAEVAPTHHEGLLFPVSAPSAPRLEGSSLRARGRPAVAHQHPLEGQRLRPPAEAPGGLLRCGGLPLCLEHRLPLPSGI